MGDRCAAIRRPPASRSLPYRSTVLFKEMWGFFLLLQNHPSPSEVRLELQKSVRIDIHGDLPVWIRVRKNKRVLWEKKDDQCCGEMFKAAAVTMIDKVCRT